MEQAKGDAEAAQGDRHPPAGEFQQAGDRDPDEAVDHEGDAEDHGEQEGAVPRGHHDQHGHDRQQRALGEAQAARGADRGRADDEGAHALGQEDQAEPPIRDVERAVE